jgi:hypothetical protein
MAATFDRAEVLRALQILYPPEHGIIELAILKRSGQILPGHFDDRTQLLAEIEKHDASDDVLAIYTGLNTIKPEAFTRPDKPLEVNNKVGPGQRTKGEDIARITGLLFDIDPFRINGDRKDSTTEEEHQAGLEAADWLKHELSFMGWSEPVVGDSGNGGQLRYAVDLPSMEESSNLIRRMLEAANNILPDRFRDRVEVDITTHDRPRISKVFGTMSRKGAGTAERPWRRARIISAPEKLEPVQLDCILKLIGRNSEKGDAPILKDRIKPLSEVAGDPNIRPCLKEIVLKTDIKKLEEVAAHEHKGRVAIATELIMAGYSDAALHEFFSRLDDYDVQKTTYQLNQIVASFISKGGKPWKCETLRDMGVVPVERCEDCRKAAEEGDPFRHVLTISEEELEAYSPPSGPKLECKLSKNHFIQRYMAYGADVSDAYDDYWFAGAIYALAVVADKKIKVQLRQGIQYTNLYVSINGKSSLSRKSTVVDKTEEMLCNVLPDLRLSLIPTEFSPEAFIEHLSDHNHAPWIRDEAAGVLSLMKRDYMRGFKDSLMQLYDCKPFHRKLRTTQRKNVDTEFRVDDPYLNLMFATTDASLGANTEQNDTLSGFMARFLFFFPQGKKSKWMPLEEGTAQNSIFEEAVRNQLSGIARRMAELEGCTALHLSPEAAAYYTEWQKIREDEWTASNDGFCMQIYSRLAPTVIKLSMLFELGSPDFDVSRPIRLEFVQEACRLVDEYFMPTARAVYDIVGTNAERNVIDRITAYLKNHGGKASKRDIMRSMKIKSADFNDYLDTMVESGAVETKMLKHDGKGRDTLYVFLLQSVTNVTNVPKVTSVTKVPSRISSGDVEVTLGTLGTLVTQGTEETPKQTLGPEPAVKMLLLKDYRTQKARPGIPNAFDDVLYKAGTVAAFERWKADQLIERGIAEEAPA